MKLDGLKLIVLWLEDLGDSIDGRENLVKFWDFGEFYFFNFCEIGFLVFVELSFLLMVLDV